MTASLFASQGSEQVAPLVGLPATSSPPKQALPLSCWFTASGVQSALAKSKVKELFGTMMPGDGAAPAVTTGADSGAAAAGTTGSAPAPAAPVTDLGVVGSHKVQCLLCIAFVLAWYMHVCGNARLAACNICR